MYNGNHYIVHGADRVCAEPPPHQRQARAEMAAEGSFHLPRPCPGDVR